MRDDGLDDWSEKLPDGANGMNGAAVLPRLVINGKDLTATAKQLAGLFAADGRFLTNGNTPVMVTPDKGMPRAIEVTPDSVRIVAHEISRPVTISKKSKLVEVTLSKDVANLYLVGLEGRWGLNPLHGITTAPILEDDGSIRIAEGYDVKSGLWCHAVPDLKMQEQPTTNDAKRALIRLRRYFRTFAFADGIRAKNTNPAEIDISTNPGMDESVFLVALMMAVCRQSLELAPGFLCDAPSISGSGTGKGLLVKSMVMIASGIRPAAFTSGHDKEEFDKRLTAALIEARPAIFLDNYNAKDLKSDILASVLTESPAMVRVMGRTKTVPLHARTFIGITGNGVTVAEDMARRLLRVTLDAQMENPEQRLFKPGFLGSVATNRATLMSDVLTVWRWGRQNKIDAGKPLGSYEVWAQWCRDPLLALGCKDPVARITDIKAADPSRMAVIEVFELWKNHHQRAWMKSTDLHDAVMSAIAIASKAHTGSGEPTYSRQLIARYLKTHAGTCIGGFTLEQDTKTDITRPSHLYRLNYEER